MWLRQVTNVRQSLKEKDIGDVKLEEVKEQKYLGFVISSEGNNMANIRAIGIGIQET